MLLRPASEVLPIFSMFIWKFYVMSTTTNNRISREDLLRQKARVIWLTGLSGAGKTTLAEGLRKELHTQGRLCTVLDGDVLRTGLNNGLGFSETDRTENVRRAAETARILMDTGVITICSFVSPTTALRDLARTIIGADDFIEVFINASLDACEKRDVKGLYAKARRGEIPVFTGISAPFEAPTQPQLTIRTDQQSYEDSLKELLKHITPQIRYENSARTISY
jgi:adenylylsulfate kinase